MNALIGIVIFLLSLIFSGLLYMFGVIQLTPIPYNLWLIICVILFSVVFKIRFKNKRVLRFFLLRKWVEFNSWFHKIDKKMTVGSNHKLTSMEEKAIKLWKICLKDKECMLQSSISNRQRQLESGNILIVLTPYAAEFSKMSIFDGTGDSKCNFYEVNIPHPHLTQICDQFDLELERRMFKNESERKEIIEDTMETMIRKQEESIKNRKS